jgi:menaquinone-dependent protoporphyrinogen oxidase
MRVLVIYTTRHGTSQKIARAIQHSSSHQVRLHNLKKNNQPDLDRHDFIVLGSSIHAGRIPRRLRRFIRKKSDQLLAKPLAIYLCCMDLGNSEKQMEANFPKPLREHAIELRCLGGEFLFEKMNKIEKTLVKKIAGADGSKSNLRHDALQSFIQSLNKIKSSNVSIGI